MKALKTWIIAHKLLSIVIAAVFAVGTTTAIVLPIALRHEHTFADEWSQDGESHWHACTGKDCNEISDKAAHVYDNACDATCNVCGATRTVGEHVYENAYDANCKICGAARALRYQAKDEAEWNAVFDFHRYNSIHLTAAFGDTYAEFVYDGNVIKTVTYENSEGEMIKDVEMFYVKDGENYYCVIWRDDNYDRESCDRDDYEAFFEELPYLCVGTLKYEDFKYSEATHQYSNGTATSIHTLIFVNDGIAKIEAAVKGLDSEDSDMVCMVTVTFEENTVTLPAAHVFAETLTFDGENHYYACTDEGCDAKIRKEAHNFVTKKDETNHWQECLTCGYKKDVTAHSLRVAAINTANHVVVCYDCNYGATISHTYENGTATECDVCHRERTETTLAFKSDMSFAAKTYNGQVQTFDKSALVSTNVSLDDVIVEYSASKTNPDWTAEPKNAGTYYIRLRVEATDEHTSCTVDSLNDDGKTLVINKKTLALTDLVLVYGKDDLISGGRHYIDLTSSDIAGICGSDVLKVNMFIPSGSVLTSGDKWIIRDSTDYEHLDNSFSFSTDSKNYKLDNTTVGKLIIAYAVTESGSGTAESPYTYTSSALTVEKNKVVYYSVNFSRTNRGTANGAFASEYSVSLASGVEIVEVIVRDSNIRVTTTADGYLLLYGTETEPTVILGVKYTGTETSVSNTFKLTEKIATRTVTDADTWEKALKFTDGGYQVVLEKDGTVIENCKYQNLLKATNYYKNWKGDETYYTVKTSTTGFECYIFEKNVSGAWERRSLTDAYGSDEEAKADILDGIKLSGYWLENIAGAEAFATFAFSEEDQMYHTETSYTLGNSVLADEVVTTHIALKFENGKLVYAEFTDGTNNYTVKVTNMPVNIILPSIYTDVAD